MKRLRYLSLIVTIFIFAQCNGQQQPLKSTTVKDSSFNPLSEEEKRVILEKGTEYPFSGIYYNHHDSGQYVCKQCNTPLFESSSKFNSGTGWPSFDDAIDSNVREVPDADGRRVEIVCNTCGGHLGHVFRGENFTPKSTRHCVNSISLNFIPASSEKRDTAVFASGCFWGTEYFLQKPKGVISTEPGYTGGTVKNPSYKQVCSGMTGHYEAVRVIYNPDSVSFEELAKLYFETHDPTQTNGQGPDIGPQYLSAVFYQNEAQKEITNKLINELNQSGLKVATKVLPAATFWVAEEYHHHYYKNNGKTPYCHRYVKRFK